MSNPNTPQQTFTPIVDRVSQAEQQGGVDFTVDRAPAMPTGAYTEYSTSLNVKGRLAAGAALIGTIATLAVGGNAALNQAEQEDQGYRQQAVEQVQKNQYK